MVYHLQEWANNPNGALVGAIGLRVQGGRAGIDAEGSTGLSCARVYLLPSAVPHFYAYHISVAHC